MDPISLYYTVKPAGDKHKGREERQREGQGETQRIKDRKKDLSNYGKLLRSPQKTCCRDQEKR